AFIDTPLALDAGVGEFSTFQGEDIGTVPLIARGETGTLRFLFSASGGAGVTRTMTLSGLSITAIVPEPSSALLLTGVLGLFGSTFRRRRSLAGTSQSI